MEGKVTLFFLGISTVVYILTDLKLLLPTESVACQSALASRAPVIPSEDYTLTHNRASNSTLFPKRLISVFGLEKSGTTWMSLTIAKALGIVPETQRYFAYSKHSADKNFEVQHISQPWGSFPNQPVKWSCHARNLNRTKTAFAAVPLACANHSRLAKKSEHSVFPEVCKSEAHLDDFVQVSSRFFVNITSHIQWYLEHGVDATAVILMRDNSIAHISKTNSICSDANVSQAQNEYANKITREAIEMLPPERVVLVSFEGMVSLGMPYLQDVFRRLGIHSATHVPDFRDANKKYINADLLRVLE